MSLTLNAHRAITLFGCREVLHYNVGTFSLPDSIALAVNLAIKMALSSSLDQASPENLGQIRHFS